MLLTIILLNQSYLIHVTSADDLNVPSTDPIEISALLQIKQIYIGSTNGPTFLSYWNETSDPCQNTWPNVICACDGFGSSTTSGMDLCDGYEPPLDDMSHIISLRFRDDLFKFNGRLSDEFGKLKMLRKLDMSVNSFTGPIPDSFADLTNLRELKLSQNQLSGDLPSFIGNFKDLKLLNLAYNDFSGSIPDAWCNHWSSSTGEIPDIDLRYNHNLCGFKFNSLLLFNV